MTLEECRTSEGERRKNEPLIISIAAGDSMPEENYVSPFIERQLCMTSINN